MTGTGISDTGEERVFKKMAFWIKWVIALAVGITTILTLLATFGLSWADGRYQTNAIANSKGVTQARQDTEVKATLQQLVKAVNTGANERKAEQGRHLEKARAGIEPVAVRGVSANLSTTAGNRVDLQSVLCSVSA